MHKDDDDGEGMEGGGEGGGWSWMDGWMDVAPSDPRMLFCTPVEDESQVFLWTVRCRRKRGVLRPASFVYYRRSREKEGGDIVGISILAGIRLIFEFCWF